MFFLTVKFTAMCPVIDRLQENYLTRLASEALAGGMDCEVDIAWDRAASFVQRLFGQIVIVRGIADGRPGV